MSREPRVPPHPARFRREPKCAPDQHKRGRGVPCGPAANRPGPTIRAAIGQPCDTRHSAPARGLPPRYLHWARSLPGGAVLPLKSEFSEVTFAFAYVRELVGEAFLPEFPSTNAEGVAGGGWDVKIDSVVAPAYYQFKVVEEVVGNNAGQRTEYADPYLRFKLRTGYGNVPDQHQLLIDLVVRYVSYLLVRAVG